MPCDQDVLICTQLCNGLQSINPGSIDEPLLEESQNFMTRACVRMYSGRNALEPDVMLKLGNDMLPAHRSEESLLAESSDFYKAMFQVSCSESI